MSQDYTSKKVAQSLQVADGDSKRAAKDLLELCVRDHEFLLGLTAPFLQGIIGHSLQRARRTDGQGAVDEKTPEVLNVKTMSEETGLAPDTIESLLADTLSSHKFGTQDRSRSSLGKRPKASQDHVNALKAIAKDSAE